MLPQRAYVYAGCNDPIVSLSMSVGFGERFSDSYVDVDNCGYHVVTAASASRAVDFIENNQRASTATSCSGCAEPQKDESWGDKVVDE